METPRMESLEVMLGRETELTLTLDLLKLQNLVTITGPGGVGKTRLAHEVQRLCCTQQTVHFVDLTQLRDVQLIDLEVLLVRELQAPEHLDPREALDVVFRSGMLLILDNFEHLMEFAPILPVWLKHPHLRLLITSRQSLNQGGVEVQLLPFEVPSEAQGTHPAVQCLTRAIQKHQKDFQFTRENQPLLVRLCQQLSGLPLAMELMAVHVAQRSLRQVLTDLESLAIQENPDFPERHASLNQIAAWSVNLLPDEQRVLFSQLGVLQGTFRQGMMEAMLGWTPGTATQPLQNLKRHALLSEKPEGSYFMLETLRHHAVGCLHRTGLHDDTQLKLQQWCIQSLERIEQDFRTHRQTLVFQEVHENHHHHQAALTWALHPTRPTSTQVRGAHHACLLQFYWYHGGHQWEGQHWLRTVLGKNLPLSKNLHLKLHNALSNQYSQVGKIQLSIQELKAAMRHFDHDTPEVLKATIYANLGLRLQSANQFQEAHVWMQKGLRTYQDIPFVDGIMRSLNNLGHLLLQTGQYPEAEKHLREGIRIARQQERTDLLSMMIQNLGVLASLTGDLTTQYACFTEALQLARGSSYVWGVACNLMNLANCMLDSGSSENVLEWLQESGELITLHHLQNIQAFFWVQLARYHQSQGQAEESSRLLKLAAQLALELQQPVAVASAFNHHLKNLHHAPHAQAKLLGFLHSWLGEQEVPWGKYETDLYQQHLHDVQQVLPTSAFHQAFEQGQSDTVQRVLHELTLQPEVPPSGAPCPLTTKELQVLKALAAGKSNKQIGSELHISPVTVRHHVTHILQKLECQSRTKAVTLALQNHWLGG